LGEHVLVMQACDLGVEGDEARHLARGVESQRGEQRMPPPWRAALLRRDGSERMPARVANRVQLALLRNHV